MNYCHKEYKTIPLTEKIHNYHYLSIIYLRLDKICKQDFAIKTICHNDENREKSQTLSA